MKKFLCLLVFAGVVISVQAQIDSLKYVISKATDDTSKVKSLIALSKKSFSSENREWLGYANQALVLSKKLNFQKGLALSFHTIGIGYYRNGEYVEAINNWDQALLVYRSRGNMAGVSNILNNKGAIFSNQGNLVKALEFHFQALRIAEDIKDTLRIVTALTNIGSDYSEKTTMLQEAKEYFLRALPLAIKIRDRYMMGTAAVNLGDVYFKTQDFTTALKYFEQSITYYEGEDDIPYSLNYIGKVYRERREYNNAILRHKQALEISRKLDAKLDMVISLNELAATYSQKGETGLAVSCYLQAEPLAVELHSPLELRSIYGGLAKLYADNSNFQSAFKFQQLLVVVKDSMNNIDVDKKMQGFQFDFEMEEKESHIALLTKEKEIQTESIGRQKLVRNSLLSLSLVLFSFAGVFLRQRIRISKEKLRSEHLLLNILPSETAQELIETGAARAKRFDSVSVLFTEFKNFSYASEKLGAIELVAEINYCYSEFDRIIEANGLEKIKTIGNSYMCAGGLPVSNTSHPEDAVRAGLAMQHFVEKTRQDRITAGLPFFDLLVGIHSGHVIAGVVGLKKFAYDIWGDTVNTASRMESSGEAGKVNISGVTYELVRDKFRCIARGRIEVKGKGEIDMYFVEGTQE